MKKFFCNPLNLKYPYQFIDFVGDKTVNREGADPSIIEWNGIYYLFVSMTTGFWYSQDLVQWDFKQLKGEVIYDYAPDVRVINGFMYLSASKSAEHAPIYRSKDPINEPFEKFTDIFTYWDPNLFQDDDGKTYFYWGCSNKHPIWGIELDANTLQPMSEKVELIFGRKDEHGFERKGDDHRYSPKTEKEKLMAQYIGLDPFIEGAWMTKHHSIYYLQYAAPATQNNIYGDGVYTSNHPLGPFVYQKNNPFSYKPGGFIPGAGHGSTMKDSHGNWWHASTMVISMNHQFERRIGLFPAGFDQDGELFCNTSYGDWPIEVKEKIDPWQDPVWMLLSYGKKTSASSYTLGHQPSLCVDENIKTWWTAQTANRHEWLEIDLGEVMEVHAIQVNFADDKIPFILPEGISLVGNEHTKRYIDINSQETQFLLEGSIDGEKYEIIHDKRMFDTDLAHDCIIIEHGINYRYIRISDMSVPYQVNPSLSGLRIFGLGNKMKPTRIEDFQVEFENDLDLVVSWQENNALGYNVYFGYEKHKLYHSYMVYGVNNVPIRALNKGQELFIRIDTFNENGITTGETKKVL